MAALFAAKLARLAAASCIVLSAAACKHRNTIPSAAATLRIGTDESWVAPAKEIQANLKNLRAPDVHQRRQAVYELATSNSPQVATRLLEIVYDDDPVVATFAVLGLGLLREKRAVPRLLPLLANEVAPRLRREAAWALGRVGDARAVPELSRILAESTTELQRSAAQALARIRDGEPIRRLMSGAGGRLGGWNTPLSGVALVLDRLQKLPDGSPPDNSISDAWSLVLSELPECRGVRTLLERRAGMKSGIVHEDDKRVPMRDPLGRLPEGCMSVLAEQAKTHASANVRRLALRALANYATPPVREVAKQACSDTDNEVAAEAARLYATLGGRLPANDVRSSTLEALDPRDPDAIPKIASLWRFGGQWDVIDRLGERIDAYRWLERLDLAERGPSAPIPPTLLVKWLALAATSPSDSNLGPLMDGSPEAIAPALEVASREIDIRGPAQSLLNRILTRAAELGQTDRIARLFRGVDAKRRALIVNAPLPIDNPEILSLLREAARDRDPTVRRATLSALRAQKRVAQLEDAMTLLHDPDRGVQSEALVTLAALGDERHKVAVLDPSLARVPELRGAWLEAALVFDPARADQLLAADLQGSDPVLLAQWRHFLEHDGTAPRALHALGRVALNHLGRDDPNRRYFAQQTKWTTPDALAEIAGVGADESQRKAFLDALSDPDLQLRRDVVLALARAIKCRNPHPTLVQWFNSHFDSFVALAATDPDFASELATSARRPDALFALARQQSDPVLRWRFVERAFEVGTTLEQRNRWLPQLAPPDDDSTNAAIERLFDNPAVRQSPDWLIDYASPNPKFATITEHWLRHGGLLSVEETPRDQVFQSAALALLDKPKARAIAGCVLGNLADPSTLPHIRRALAGQSNEGSVELIRAAYLAALAGNASTSLFETLDGRFPVDAPALALRFSADPKVPAKLIVELGALSDSHWEYSLQGLLARHSDPHLNQLLIRLSDEPGLLASVLETRIERGVALPLSLARQAIHDPDPTNQRVGAMALGAARQVEWLPRILRATCDTPNIAHFATQAFSSRELTCGLSAESALVRACTLDLLSQRASFDLEPALIAALRDLSPIVQERAIALAILHPTSQVVATVEQVLRERILPQPSFGHYLVFFVHSKGHGLRARLEALSAVHRPRWYQAYRELLDQPARVLVPSSEPRACSTTGDDDWFVAEIFTNGAADSKNGLLDCMARDNGSQLLHQLGQNPVFLAPEVVTLLTSLLATNPRLGNNPKLVELLDRMDTVEARALVRRIASGALASRPQAGVLLWKTDAATNARHMAQLTQQRWRLTPPLSG